MTLWQEKFFSRGWNLENNLQKKEKQQKQTNTLNNKNINNNNEMITKRAHS